MALLAARHFVQGLSRREEIGVSFQCLPELAGGFIPLGPYIILTRASTALIVSVIITLTALAVFGYVKGRFTGAPPLRSAIQTVVIGGLAAAVAFMIARVIS